MAGSAGNRRGNDFIFSTIDFCLAGTGDSRKRHGVLTDAARCRPSGFRRQRTGSCRRNRIPLPGRRLHGCCNPWAVARPSSSARRARQPCHLAHRPLPMIQRRQADRERRRGNEKAPRQSAKQDQHGRICSRQPILACRYGASPPRLLPTGLRWTSALRTARMRPARHNGENPSAAIGNKPKNRGWRQTRTCSSAPAARRNKKSRSVRIGFSGSQSMN